MAIKQKKVKKELEEYREKAGSPWDYIKWLTVAPRKWEELSEAERNGFSPFIVNRFISMDFNFCGAINDLQRHMSNAAKDVIWKLYAEIFKGRRINYKYVKPEVLDVTDRDIEIFKIYFRVSREIAVDYIFTMNKTEQGKQKIKEITDNFIYDKKI